MQMKCRKYPCEEKISKNVHETNLKKKNEILEILSEKDILEITIKNAEIFFHLQHLNKMLKKVLVKICQNAQKYFK